jgi:phenylpyruvate tautomerase
VWDRSTEPCGTATLLSIGKLGVEENKKHAAVLFDHIEKNLGIPRDR